MTTSVHDKGEPSPKFKFSEISAARTGAIKKKITNVRPTRFGGRSQ
jgi:hypothetical protein